MKRFACTCMLLALPSLCMAEKPSPQMTAFVKRYAAHYNVPQELISALIDVESRWNPRAVSPKGAIGLMQLMPATARHFGAFNPYDPEQNIAAGTRYVTVLMHEFDGDLRLVVAAYNAGDVWVGRKQLKYRNSDVVAYVTSVRQRYLQRRSSAAMLPGGQK
ncbi:MAG TPA: lytic transglycosylase domain-containing protein [Acidobacteriaceae bacterium]